MVQLRRLLYLEMLGTFLVAGLFNYFLESQVALWVPYAFALYLFSYYYIAGSLSGTKLAVPSISQDYPLFLIFFMVFLLDIITVSVPNFYSLPSFLVGLKIYLPMSLMIFVVFAVKSKEFISGLEYGALFCSVVQLPFVLFQHYYVAGVLRAGGESPFDAVDGTFGGHMFAGGQNGTLMYFAILAILVALGMYQTNRLSGGLAFVLIAINVAVIALGEVKAVFFLLPMALAVQQARNFARRPLTIATGAAGLGLVLFAVAEYYKRAYWDPNAGRNLTLAEQATSSLAYFFDVNYANYATGEVSRAASLMLWWTDPQNDISHRLFGYGPGAARTTSTVATGLLSQRYGSLEIASTSLAQLLWDSGIVGTICFVLALVTAAWNAFHKGLHAVNRVAEARYLTIAAMLAMLIVTLIYNFSLTDDGAVQLLLAILMGLLLEARPASVVRSTVRRNFVAKGSYVSASVAPQLRDE